MKVRVKKTASLNQESKWNIREGKVYEGTAPGFPVVGLGFYVHGRLHTSQVTEIIDNHHFRTLNSIYHFEVVKDDKANTVDSGGLGEIESFGQDLSKESGSGGKVMGRGIQEELRDLLKYAQKEATEWKSPFKINL